MGAEGRDVDCGWPIFPEERVWTGPAPQGFDLSDSVSQIPAGWFRALGLQRRRVSSQNAAFHSEQLRQGTGCLPEPVAERVDAELVVERVAHRDCARCVRTHGEFSQFRSRDTCPRGEARRKVSWSVQQERRAAHRDHRHGGRQIREPNGSAGSGVVSCVGTRLWTQDHLEGAS